MVILNNIEENWINATGSGDSRMVRDILLDQLASACVHEPAKVRLAVRQSGFSCDSKDSVFLARKLAEKLSKSEDLCEKMTRLIAEINKENADKPGYQKSETQEQIRQGLSSLFNTNSPNKNGAKEAKKEIEEKTVNLIEKEKSLNLFKKKSGKNWLLIIGLGVLGTYLITRYLNKRKTMSSGGDIGGGESAPAAAVSDSHV